MLRLLFLILSIVGVLSDDECSFVSYQRLNITPPPVDGIFQVRLLLNLSSSYSTMYSFESVRFRSHDTSSKWLDFWVERLGDSAASPPVSAKVWLIDVPLFVLPNSSHPNYVGMYWDCRESTSGAELHNILGSSYGTKRVYSGRFVIPTSNYTGCPGPAWTNVDVSSDRLIKVSFDHADGIEASGSFETHSHSMAPVLPEYDASNGYSVSCTNGTEVYVADALHSHTSSIGDFSVGLVPDDFIPESVRLKLCERGDGMLAEIHEDFVLSIMRGDGSRDSDEFEAGFIDVTRLHLLATSGVPDLMSSVGRSSHRHEVIGSIETSVPSVGCEYGDDEVVVATHDHSMNVYFDASGSNHPSDVVDAYFITTQRGQIRDDGTMAVFATRLPPAGWEEVREMTGNDYFLIGSNPSGMMTYPPTISSPPLDPHWHQTPLIPPAVLLTDEVPAGPSLVSVNTSSPIGMKTSTSNHGHQVQPGLFFRTENYDGAVDRDRIQYGLYIPVESPLEVWSMGDVVAMYNPVYCEGRFAGSPDVCRQRGHCVEQDTSECDLVEGFTGNDCQFAVCGILCDADWGECSLSGNECVCNDVEKYAGPSCDHPVCPDDCGESGECLSPGVCECADGSDLDPSTFCQSSFGDTPIEAIIGGVLGGVVGLAIFGALCFALVVIAVVCARKKGNQGDLPPVDEMGEIEENEAKGTVAKLEIDKTLFEISYSDLVVKKSIGRGGSSATVFRAVWRETVVAFKVFKLRDFLDQAKFGEFENEVKLAASLLHPHILRFYGACLRPPRVGIVMELCEHGDIAQFLEGNRNTSQSIRMRWLSEIASAVCFLHKKSIIHRDLKPENVLLADDELNAKLMDFGLSRAVESGTSQTKTVRIGTNLYMAPEIILGDGQYDEKIDVFSFGIMMYVILTGNLAPYGPNTLNIEFRVANDPTLRPSFKKFASKIPSEVIAIAEASWEASADTRPSIEEVADVVDAAIAFQSGEKSVGGVEEVQVQDDVREDSPSDEEEEEEEEEEEDSDSSDSA